ncbi:hypothetical protein SAMN05444141_10388 [Pseudovibrio denitrificans]|uniref:Uncharacterized protein n=1 Tax=Pseudovibrio denitrificans TaxID=258256 RepID=A0A1I7AHY3_9HYPH|nr:hypothetical protein SAMN05444141_10388 [Pseudovibrio denitrificans]
MVNTPKPRCKLQSSKGNQAVKLTCILDGNDAVTPDLVPNFSLKTGTAFALK